MNIALYHGKTASALVIDEDVIQYTQKSHRYRSEADFSTLKTELATNGHSAANLVKEWLVVSRKEISND